MDRREALTQTRTPVKGQSALAPSAWPTGRLGWTRRLRRVGSSALTLRIPRGLGASAAALLLLVSVVYGAICGGHVSDIAAHMRDICNKAADNFGFRITEVAITGEHQLSRAQIIGTAGLTTSSSLLFFDVVQARAQLLNNPWIEQASVFKLYPGRLQIVVNEREAFALWQKNGQIVLIAKDGTVLAHDVPQRFTSLPLVVGKGADHAAPNLLRSVARFPDIADRVESAVLVAERRWNLQLRDGVEILLPEDDVPRALGVLAALARTKNLLSRDIVVIDLRLADRLIVRQSEAAAQARDAEINAAKNTKKKNGSDA